MKRSEAREQAFALVFERTINHEPTQTRLTPQAYPATYWWMILPNAWRRGSKTMRP
ncbi:MAG: hypothetical protein ACLSB9_29815 [Hydrogeniiclostridium mannosilyticum]